MRRTILALVTVIALALSACASSPAETESASPALGAQSGAPSGDDAPTTDAAADSTPTPVQIPTTDPAPSSTPAQGDQTVSDQDSSAQPRPTQTGQFPPLPTSTPVPTPRPTTAALAQSSPAQAATPAPTAAPTSAAASVYIDPDCYVGTGAADEPVWWCDGRICVVGDLHYGCPATPPDPRINPICSSPRSGAAAQAVVPCDQPICLANGRYFVCQPTRPPLNLSCSVSDDDIVVNEIITITAVQNPVLVAVQVAISHGDGTIDHTWESRAYYEAPGSYPVKLLYSHTGGKGSIDCGTVRVRAGHQPTPTPTPTALQVGCTISPNRTVRVNEILTFTAFQQPESIPVTYVFDHGDGTLDETSQSRAYYAAPGYYQVRLNWAAQGRSGTVLCGTVTVEAAVNTADYLGRTAESAQALAAGRGLTTRIVRIDDIVYPGTTDYRLDRLNLEIDAGKVTAAYIG